MPHKGLDVIQLELNLLTNDIEFDSDNLPAV